MPGARRARAWRNNVPPLDGCCQFLVTFGCLLLILGDNGDDGEELLILNSIRCSIAASWTIVIPSCNCTTSATHELTRMKAVTPAKPLTL